MNFGTVTLALVWIFFLALGFSVGWDEIWYFGVLLIAITIAIGIDKYNTSKK